MTSQHEDGGIQLGPQAGSAGQLAHVQPAYVLQNLGQSAVLVDGQEVVWPARSAEELLWYLAAHPEGKYRHDILAQLWNLDDLPTNANRFRVALHRLRSVLGRPDAVTEQAGRYRLHPDLLTATQSHTLMRVIEQARHAPPGTHWQHAQVLRQTLEQAGGEYLPHLQGEWVEQARAEWHTAVAEGHLLLSQLHCAAHECPLAAQALALAAQADPLMSEDHHQRLMTCLAMTRDRYAAIEHYRRYRYFLAHEVGDTPMPDTEALAERIKAGERPCWRQEQEQADYS